MNTRLWITFILTCCALPATADRYRLLFEEYATARPVITTEMWHLHDPSSIVELNGWQTVVVTGKENTSEYECGLESWRRKDDSSPWRPHLCVFPTKPDWIAEELPANDGAFWAPDLASDGTLVYSVANGFDDTGS